MRYRNENQIDIFQPGEFYDGIPHNYYMGYAVTSAQFNKPKYNTTYYVASAPRHKSEVLNNMLGKIFIFDIVKRKASISIFEDKLSLYGSQTGEYYGYSLLVEDFNNDGLPDLVVSAPLHSNDTYHESGAVYIYMNKGNVSYFSIVK